MEKILVTGGTGFLGSHLISSFNNSADYQVFSCSRSEGVDLRNYRELESFVQKTTPDILIHCAAHVGGIAYDEMHPVEIFEDNLTIGLNTVKAVAENNIRCLINMMPNCTYPAQYDEYKEEIWWHGEMHPSVVVYGLPKKMMKVACFAYLKKYNFRVAHIVFPNLYGPGDHFDPIRSHALGALIAKIVNAKFNGEKTVKIWGTGKPVREWLYIEDAADAILAVLDNINAIKNNDLLNFGVNQGISIGNLAQLIKELSEWEGEFEFDVSKPDGAKTKLLSAEKLKTIFHWEPKHNLRNGVEQTISWYRASCQNNKSNNNSNK